MYFIYLNVNVKLDDFIKNSKENDDFQNEFILILNMNNKEFI